MECRVEFDYEAQESDELNLKKGDVITNVVTKMDGWWEGTLSSTGLRGMFPDNFVKVVTAHSTSSGDEVQSSGDAVQMRKKAGNHARRLKAMYSYSPEQEDELQLEVGDVVDFIAEVEEGWWRGQLKGKTGIFPSNFVSEVESATAGAVNGNKHDSQELSKYGKPKENKNRASANKIPPDVVPAEKPTALSSEEEPAPKLPPKPVREIARCFYPYAAQNEDELELKEGDIVVIIGKDCEDEGWWRGELRGKTGLFPDNFVQIISPNEAASESQYPSAANTTSSGQPHTAVTASERTSEDSFIGVGGIKKELPSPTTPNTTVTDGSGSSKFSIKKEKGLGETEKEKDSSILPKKSLFLNKSKDKPAPTIPKLAAHSSPVSSRKTFNQQKSIEIKREKSLDEPVQPVVDFNGVERGEKLTHLTVNRAKAPRRRPPSTGPKENEGVGLNGSVSNSFDETYTDNSPAPPSPAPHSPGLPFNSSLKSNANSAITPPALAKNDSFSRKSTPPNPVPSAITPTPPSQKAPIWIAELRKKQDEKSPGSGSSSVSPIPPTKEKDRNSSGGNPASTPPFTREKEAPTTAAREVPGTRERESPVSVARVPALPKKPILSQITPGGKLERGSSNSPTTPTPPPISNIQNNMPPTNNANISTTNITNNNLSSVASKFGGQKRTVTTITATANHVVPAAGTTVGNGSSGDVQQNIPQVVSGGGITPEWVSYEEYAKLKERMSIAEAEIEMLKKQVKLVLDMNSKGHIV